MGAYRLDEAKELAIYQWVASTLGITSIWDKPDAPRPSLPYATLNISSGPRTIGQPEERHKGTDTYTYCIRKVVTLTVNVYADHGHLALIATLLDSLVKPTVQDTLRAAGLAIWDNSDPLDISQLLDTRFESRATVDIFLAYATEVDDVPGEIHKVTAEGMIGGIVTEHTVEIST